MKLKQLWAPHSYNIIIMKHINPQIIKLKINEIKYLAIIPSKVFGKVPI